MSLVPKSPVQHRLGKPLVLLTLLFALVFFLWRAGIVPGIWDLQHLGRDVQLEAQIERASHRSIRLESFDAETQPDTAVVFLGSSTIEGFPLEELFPGARCLNRGIGDERAELLQERMDRGIDWTRIAGVVLYAGSVDFRRLGIEPAKIAQSVDEILVAIDQRAPGIPVLLLGLLSQRNLNQSMAKRLGQTNLVLKELATRHKADFLDTDRSPLSGPNGRLEDAYSKDRLHLNRLGYQVLARWIRQDRGPIAALLFP